MHRPVQCESTDDVLRVDRPDVKEFRHVMFEHELDDGVELVFLLVEVGEDADVFGHEAARDDATWQSSGEDLVYFGLVDVEENLFLGHQLARQLIDHLVESEERGFVAHL